MPSISPHDAERRYTSDRCCFSEIDWKSLFQQNIFSIFLSSKIKTCIIFIFSKKKAPFIFSATKKNAPFFISSIKFVSADRPERYIRRYIYICTYEERYIRREDFSGAFYGRDLAPLNAPTKPEMSSDLFPLAGLWNCPWRIAKNIELTHK